MTPVSSDTMMLKQSEFSLTPITGAVPRADLSAQFALLRERQQTSAAATHSRI
jgi:hypothetical protein